MSLFLSLLFNILLWLIASIEFTHNYVCFVLQCIREGYTWSLTSVRLTIQFYIDNNTANQFGFAEMLNFGRARTQQRPARSSPFGGENQNHHKYWQICPFLGFLFSVSSWLRWLVLILYLTFLCIQGWIIQTPKGREIL